MIFYEVVSRYFDDRKDTFDLNVIERETIPENTFVCLKTRDVYRDYFASEEEAKAFIANSQKGVVSPDGSVNENLISTESGTNK